LAAFAPAVPVAAADVGLAVEEVDDVTLGGAAAGGVAATAEVVLGTVDVPFVGPTGAVDAPLIWAWISGENTPVMPVMVNLAEKARAGIVGVAVSLREIDSIRMKYWLLFGPIVGSGVNSTDPAVDKSRLGVMVCRSVCC